MELTAEEITMLAIERRAWQSLAAKEQRVRDLLGWTMVRYYQRLHVLADRPEALVAAPGTVRRLQRLEAERRHRRRLLTGGS